MVDFLSAVLLHLIDAKTFLSGLLFSLTRSIRTVLKFLIEAEYIVPTSRLYKVRVKETLKCAVLRSVFSLPKIHNVSLSHHA